ncbi:MAG TPA: hypothetical protein VGD08_08710 [Stellaceae bacterium]
MRASVLRLRSAAGLALMLAVAALLLGCGTVREELPSSLPVAPGAAAFVGSRQEPPWPRPAMTAYIAAVDGRPVAGGPEAWNVPVTVPAGRHDIAVGFRQGEMSALATIKGFDAKLGAGYVARFEKPDAGSAGCAVFDCLAVAIWLQDAASGQPATDRIRVRGTIPHPAIDPANAVKYHGNRSVTDEPSY